MARFVIRKAADATYYYLLQATGNYETILRGETYATNWSCRNGIASVKDNAASEARYERLLSRNGQYYFNLKATNGQVVGTSETYVTAYNRDNGIDLVKIQAPGASIDDES